jgi:lantibiotic biosynthesis protein
VFRTPLYPLEQLQSVLSQTSFEKSMGALFDFFEKPINQEALFLASPDLHRRLMDYYKGEIQDLSKVDSLAYALMKYFQRMTTRCTPFGLFASIGVGNVDTYTEIILDNTIANNRHTRLDMNYLCALVAQISTISAIQNEIKFYPNTSIYPIGEELRYIEYNYQKTRRIHQISSVDFSEYLRIVMSVAQGGATLGELTSSILNEDVSEDESHAFVLELIESQVLINELEPSVCGDELLFQLINTLSKISEEKTFLINEKSWSIKTLVEFLRQIQTQLESIDSVEFNDVNKYLDFANELKILGVETDLGKLFQTDLVRKTEVCQVDRSILSDVKETAKFLNKISFKQGETKLEKFAKAFYERYEDAEIPLQFALDTETGIGYLQPNELQERGKISWNRVDEVLLEKIIQSREQKTQEITLTDDDFKGMKENWTDQQDTISFIVELIQYGEQIKTVFSSTGSSSAANLLGRFCHADNEIDSVVREIIQKEENLKPTGTILAEIVHLPESRTGNILMRPTLREYEIPYLSKASVSTDYQITPDDLFVSVRGNNVILRSKRLNKIIIPRLTNAHNFSSNSLPMYNFLCDLQTQHHRGGIWFSWGALEQAYQFLPRVNYKNTIISSAKWVLQKSDFEHLLKINEDDALNKSIKLWQKQWNMPQNIQLVDYDNELLIDLNNILSVKTFLNTIKKRDSIQLTEFLFTKENCLVTDAENSHFTNQFVFSYYRNEKLVEKDTLYRLPEIKSIQTVKRTFVTGEEWLYFKIYSGEKTADSFLKYGLAPALEVLKSKGLINKWFFIRYSDPKTHIRIRFQVSSPADISEITQILKENCSYFLENRLIWKLQTDTYNRELERYGASSIELAEAFFNENSEQILALLSTFEEGDEKREDEIRWFFGLKGIDVLLDCFGLLQKKQLLENLAEGFGKEFNLNIDLKKQLGERFRKERGMITNSLKSEDLLEDDMKYTFNILYSNKEKSNVIAQSILKLQQLNALEVNLNDLLGSYIHMFMNRLFIKNQRQTEMIQYHLLWHYYRSEVARAK